VIKEIYFFGKCAICYAKSMHAKKKKEEARKVTNIRYMQGNEDA